MRKKTISIGIWIIVALSLLLTWILVGPGTAFEGKSETIFIPSDDASKERVLSEFRDKKILSFPAVFSLLASASHYGNHVKPGRYTVDKGTSVLQLFRTLRNGRQTPMKLVIRKFRTREDLAGYVGRQMEMDSAALLMFFNSQDSTRLLGLDTNTIVTIVIPNTYEIYWTTPAHKVIRRLHDERNRFWSKEREAKLRDIGLTREEAYVLASIVEEESNKNDEKPTIASVYLNRLNKGMSLSADPTVKFALRNFGLKRVTIPHIRAASSSPYSTYTHKGLPPGPICTPSVQTLDAVLNAQKTDYLFFCARADFSGYHSFATNEQDHFRNARAYQRALDSLRIK